MSKELDEYIKEQNKKREKFLKKFELYKDELDKSNIPDSLKRKLAEDFIRSNNNHRTVFVKYNNFIMDIRKPSFRWFLFWCICSIFGFINIIEWLFNLMF